MTLVQIWLVLVFFSILSSLVLTRLSIRYLLFLGLVDSPGNRKVHLKPTPGGAGLVFVLLASVGIGLSESYAFNSLNYSTILIPIFLLISLVSFIDDLKDISVLIRLVVHFTSSFVALYFLLYPWYPLFHHELPAFIDLLIAVFALVTFLNIYNFLDGIDGITATESIHLSITILSLCYLKYDIIVHVNLIIIINIIVLGYSLGFLPFNWAPARIFMGDVGSISLGFLLGLCLICLASSSWHLLMSAIIASLYYICDGGLTILIRLAGREKIWQPHVKHFFQKAVQKGMSHRQVVMKIAACNALLFLLSISALYFPALSIIIAISVVMTILLHFVK